MKKKIRKVSKFNKSHICKTDREIIEEIIRVNHAGEFGATRIYDGQIFVFGKKSKIGKIIKKMADQEQEHIKFFEKKIVEKRVRPTLLLPVWNLAGFTLGILTSLMGKKAAMACTVAVEKVIGEHYEDQTKILQKDQKKLISTIKKFAEDELEHHNIGINNNAEKAPGYNIMSKFISFGCKAAITLSKKI